MTVVCPSCGATNAPTARFCGECGTRVSTDAAAASSQAPGAAASPAATSAPVAERRLVTVLFADLVGFTALAEGRDAETVRELLSRYFEIARDVIERYGGTVEKFIGDAVMAVWGTPIAHEDDAERGVRAGLELVDAVQVLGPGVQARAGVLTGEAAVTLGARDQGMVAGDLVNTASRLQSVAAPGTVLVGEATHRAASGAIVFEPAGEHALKGKEAPVSAWVALRVVSKRKGLGRSDRLEAPFVGRDSELRLLKDLFHATARENRARLVSITGQAGIGKSRLAWEFLKYVDGLVEGVWWHDGRSPAYGEGVTFWALGEMVRSRAGLLETDNVETTRTKVAEMVATHVPDEAERVWIEPAMLALLGAGEAPPGGRDELFRAWRTFFERLSSTGIVGLLFEDLHWADAGLLDFIDHLLEWSRGVPILIITLARPELLERRPDWGAGRRNFLALGLEALPESAMRELLAGLVPGLPAATTQSIIARADGIPLYAVETIRMLLSDGRLREVEGRYEPVGELGELAVPETLQALIAARLDGLAPTDRSLLQDAAVLGQSFTLAGLAAVSGEEPGLLETRLRDLERLELVAQEVDPRSPERGMYAFVQALIREVAYGTLAMRDRRARHLAAARFFESLDDQELAGALAAHYVAAYRSAPDGPEGLAVATQARIALRAAAERAEALGSLRQAVTFLEQALEVSTDDAERADLLDRAGEVATAAARSDLAIEFLVQSTEIRSHLGDRVALARTVGLHGAALTEARHREAAVALVQPAVESLGDLADHPVGIQLMSSLGRNLMLSGEYQAALVMTDRALAAAERLGLARIAAEALATKGQLAMYLGRQWEARALLEGARILADEQNLPVIGLRAMNYLASTIAHDDVAAALQLERATVELARQLGRRSAELTALGNAAEDARRTGEWAWAISELETALQLDIDDETRLTLRSAAQYYRLLQGRSDPAELEEIVARLEDLDDADVSVGSFELRAIDALTRGDWRGAHDHWMRVVGRSDLNTPYVLPRAAQAAVVAGDLAAARAAIDQLDGIGTRGRAVDADRAAIRAGLAALEGDPGAAMAGYRVAMTGWRDLGLPFDEALGALAAVSSLGLDVPGVAEWIETARATFRRLEAAPLLALLDAAVEAQGSGTTGPSGRESAAPSAPATVEDAVAAT